MAETKTVSILVNGGEASAGPPLGPSLGPLGVNVMGVVNEINSLTAGYGGMKVPVKVEVDVETKQFRVEVGVPSTAALVVREAGAEKGSGKPNETFVGNLTIKQLLKIAELKKEQSLASSTKASVKEVLGACVSMGVTVEGKDPRLFLREVHEGAWDSKLS